MRSNRTNFAIVARQKITTIPPKQDKRSQYER